MTSSTKIRHNILWLALGFVAWPFAEDGLAKDHGFQIQLRDGSVFRVDIPDGSFDWKTVAADGATSLSTFDVQKIKSLKFAVKPASDEVADIRELVTQLASDSYQERHAAESRLLKIGKPFQPIIEQARRHNEPEVRYRVERIINFLDDLDDDKLKEQSLEFDILELVDGTVLEGDIADWAVRGNWNGTEISIDRKACLYLFAQGESASQQNQQVASGTAVETRSLLSPFKLYEEIEVSDEKTKIGDLKNGLVSVDFDSDEVGDPTRSDKEFDAARLFAYKGCLLHCETLDGHVVVSSYKHKSSVSKKRSIANVYVDPKRGRSVLFRGVMRIDFCDPRNDRIAASVDTVGFFLEIVKPKHTLVQAFNAQGHVVGSTWSETRGGKRAKARQRGDLGNAFMGVRTNQPIAYLKVAANDFLDLERLGIDDLNNDFAIDDLTFAKPVAAPDLNYRDLAEEATVVITTRDSERLSCKSVRFGPMGGNLLVESATAGMADFELPLSQVEWVSWPQDREVTVPEGQAVFVMLNDGSVVHCRIDQKLVATCADDLTIDPDSVVGIWSANTTCRYPQSGDFDHGDMVAVSPLNRVALKDAQVDLQNGTLGFDIDRATNISFSDVQIGPAYKTRAASMYDLGQPEDSEGNLQFVDSAVSFWLANPPIREAGTGLLRTSDGQQFVLGGNSPFQLVKASDETVVIRHNNVDMEFDTSGIAAFNLPKE